MSENRVKALSTMEATSMVTEAYARQKAKNSQRNQKYRLLRDLFDNENDAWWSGDPTYGLPHKRVSNRYSLTFNYFAPIVLKIAAFIMADSTDFKVMPRNPSPEERVAAQKAEKALYVVHKRSAYHKTLNEIALDSAKLGTGWAKVYYDEANQITRYVYANPECVYPEPYKSVFSGRMLYVIYSYEMDLGDARLEYGNRVNPLLISEGDQEEGRESDDESAEPKVAVIEFWSEKYYILLVGDQLIENQTNPYGFVPFVPFPLITQPGRIYGKSIADWVIEPNAYYNQAVSEGADAQRLNCNPPLKYRNAPVNYAEQIINAQGGGCIPIPKEGDLDFVTWPGQPPSVEAMLNRVLQYIHDVSHIPRVAFGDIVSTNSSRVISVQYDPVVKVMKFIRDNYTVALKTLNEMLLRLVEKYEANREVYVGYLEDNYSRRLKKLRGEQPEQYAVKGKDISGHYDTEVIWPGVLPKDDLNAGRFELEKLSSKVQSIWTTQENLGILNPEDEQEIMQAELANESFYPKEAATILGAESKALSAIANSQKAAAGEEVGALPRGLAGGELAGMPPGPEAETPSAEQLERSNEQLYSE